MRNNRQIKRLYRFLIIVSAAMLAVNVVGLFHYNTIDSGHPDVLDKRPRILTARQFWEQAPRAPDEPPGRWAERMASAISKRMLLIEPKHVSPTFFENWILWGGAKIHGGYEWIDIKRAIRSGGGLCSQHAIIFNTLMQGQGFESHIVRLNGHVLNEVLIDGQWRVFDSDYDVSFDESLTQLETHPEKVYQGYRNAGWPEKTAKKMKHLFETASDNRRIRSSLLYAGAGSRTKYIVERASAYLIWLVPALVGLIGLRLSGGIRTGSVRPDPFSDLADESVHDQQVEGDPNGQNRCNDSVGLPERDAGGAEDGCNGER
jgi:hypothetical protein